MDRIRDSETGSAGGKQSVASVDLSADRLRFVGEGLMNAWRSQGEVN